MGASLILLPRASAADPFGAAAQGYVADSADHWYCFAPSIAGDEGRLHDAAAVLDLQTDMTTHFAGATCGTSTDVIWHRDNALDSSIIGIYPAFPVRGVALCVTWAFWGVCDQ